MTTVSTSALARIAVVGTSGCGKTTFARRLADMLAVTHVELDALHWGLNWTPVPDARFQALVDEATSQPSWICDGNYGPVRGLVWGRATAIVWLNYSFPVVFGRALRRSVARSWSGERLFAGNQESFRLTFLSRHSILLWVCQTFWRLRREYPRLLADAQFSHLERFELASPGLAEAWLGDVVALKNQRRPQPPTLPTFRALC